MDGRRGYRKLLPIRPGPSPLGSGFGEGPRSRDPPFDFQQDVVASAWVQTANVVLAIFAPVWVNEGKVMLPIYCSSLCGGGSLRKATPPARRSEFAMRSGQKKLTARTKNAAMCRFGLSKPPQTRMLTPSPVFSPPIVARGTPRLSDQPYRLGRTFCSTSVTVTSDSFIERASANCVRNCAKVSPAAFTGSIVDNLMVPSARTR